MNQTKPKKYNIKYSIYPHGHEHTYVRHTEVECFCDRFRSYIINNSILKIFVYMLQTNVVYYESVQEKESQTSMKYIHRT